MDNQNTQNLLDENVKRELNFEKMPLQSIHTQWNAKYKKKVSYFRKIEIIGEIVIYIFAIFAFVFVAFIFLKKYQWHSNVNANDIKQSQNPSKENVSDLQEAIIIPNDVNNANANKEYDDLHIIEFGSRQLKLT